MAEIIGLVLLVLAFPVISIVALVMTLNARDGVRRLELRIATLEAMRAGQPRVATAVEPAPAPPVQAAEPPPVILEPVAFPETPELAAPAPTVSAPAPTTLEE